MNFINRSGSVIYDGKSEEIFSTIKEISFDNVTCQVNFGKLSPIKNLEQRIRNISPDDISSGLGFTITEFDGMKIYNGSKKGLKLFYLNVALNDKMCLLIFSFGEYQPGRTICVFEAAVVI